MLGRMMQWAAGQPSHVSVQDPTMSQAQKLARLHPSYSLILTAVGLRSAAFGFGAIPLTLVTLGAYAAKGLWDEYKRYLQPPTAVKSIFQDQQIIVNHELVADLKHINTLPITSLYTTDRDLNGNALGQVNGPHFIDFYNQYLWLMFLDAQLHGGRTGLFKDYIKIISNKARQRQVDLSSVDTEMHHILTHINRSVIKYNANAPFYLRAQPFTMDLLVALAVYIDMQKPKLAGCSTGFYQKDGKDIFFHNVDWFHQRVMANYSTFTLELTESPSSKDAHAILRAGLVPADPWTLTAFKDDGSAVALNMASNDLDKHDNPKPLARPELPDVKEIIKKCSSVDEVRQYYNIKTTASSSLKIFKGAKKGDHAIFETNPTGVFRGQPYRTQPEPENICAATNHFVTKDGKPEPNSFTIGHTEQRVNNVKDSIRDNDSPTNVVNAPSKQAPWGNDTFQTFIVESEIRQEGTQHDLTVSLANKNSPLVLKEGHGIKLNLNTLFSEFKSKAIEIEKRTTQSRTFTSKVETIYAVDKALLKLHQASYSLSDVRFAELAMNTDKLYSALSYELSKIREGNPSEKAILSEDDIIAISNATHDVLTSFSSTTRVTNKEISDKLIKFSNEMNRLTSTTQAEIVRFIIKSILTVSAFSILVLYTDSLLDGKVSSSLSLDMMHAAWKFIAQNGLPAMQGAKEAGAILTGASLLAANSLYRKPHVIAAMQDVHQSLIRLTTY